MAKIALILLRIRLIEVFLTGIVYTMQFQTMYPSDFFPYALLYQVEIKKELYAYLLNKKDFTESCKNYMDIRLL